VVSENAIHRFSTQCNNVALRFISLNADEGNTRNNSRLSRVAKVIPAQNLARWIEAYAARLERDNPQ
jgi:hypothetical protein